MKQLKMLWRCRETAYPDNPWQGFRYRPFSGSEEDVRAWLDICKNGLLPPDAGEEYYRDLLVNWRDYRTRDTWLVEMGGSPVATVTAIVHPGSPAGLRPYGGGRSFLPGPGGGRTDEPHRLRRFLGSGLRNRRPEPPMISVFPPSESYLSAGFLPVDWDEDMAERWETILRDLGRSQVEMVREDGSPARLLLP